MTPYIDLRIYDDCCILSLQIGEYTKAMHANGHDPAPAQRDLIERRLSIYISYKPKIYRLSVTILSY